MNNVESFDIIADAELQWLQQDFLARIIPDGKDRPHKKEWVIKGWGRDDIEFIDRRVVLQPEEVAFKKIDSIVRRCFPDLDYAYYAYQRQYLPHATHVDDIQPSDFDRSKCFSMVIPLMEDVTFKTFVWKKEFYSSHDLELYRNEFRKNHSDYTKLNNLSTEYWLDHCRCDTTPEFVDCHELDGFYQYKLGTIGKFTRTQMHASNNWLRSGKFVHKDLIIVHTS